MSKQRTIRWGVLACGNIANKFVASVGALEDGEVVAAASRTPGKAEAFCQKWDIPEALDDYASLAGHPEVDAIYVANTHNLHLESVLLAFKARKHVLCEKPLGINAAQVQQMIAAAGETDCFLMEAMWTRFLPALQQVRRWLEEDAIGEVKLVQASFGFSIADNQRIRDPELAGGALLDLGIYPLSFASMVAGGQAPLEMNSMVDLMETGVDSSSLIQLTYPGGLRADLQCAANMKLSNEAWIIGTEGKIHIPDLFIAGPEARLLTEDQVTAVPFQEDEQTTFQHEIAEAHCCLREGLTESTTMPLKETLVLAQTMDALRKEWGVRYPGE